jgi:hypothetical protein
MILATAHITDLWLTGAGTVGARLTCTPPIFLDPGQYLLARSLDFVESLPSPLFVTGKGGVELNIVPPIPETWQVGARLALRGPFGKGFHLPESAQRVALAALDGNPYRLMALVPLALAQQAVVVLYSSTIPDHLPLEVEVFPLELLPEALQWTDYLAAAVSIKDLPRLREWIGLPEERRCPCLAQVLVITEMPCAGIADCSVCAVKTRGGWRLACKDGPVFDFNQFTHR